MASRWLETMVRGLVRAGKGYRRLPRAGRRAVLVAAALPMFALAAAGLLPGTPQDPGAAAADSPVGGASASFLHGSTGILSHDLDRVLGEIADAGPRAGPGVGADPAYTAQAIALMQGLPKDKDGNPDWARVDMQQYARDVAALGPPPEMAAPTAPVEFEALDLDEALEVLAEKIEAEAEGVLDLIRESGQGDQPRLLIAHSLPLMAGGDPWGAAANLLVAHEQDADDATPLLNLAAIANSQNLPAVSLALLDAAAGCDIGEDDSPVGMREQAALLNNRGHALVLLRRYDDAEAPLREALALNPEMSEAARNLIHVLLKQGKDEEARALAPRAVWRLRGNPAQPVPVNPAQGPAPADAPPPGGSPEAIARWARSPWLEGEDGHARLPIWIALDLSRQGQIAWPELLYPSADASYGGYYPQAAARFLAARERAAALRGQAAGEMQRMVVRRMTLADTIQQIIHTREPPLWMIEPIDTEMHRLEGGKESLILGSGQPTRFAALDAARAEYAMETTADRLNERYRREAKCPANSDTDECCAIHRREVDRNLAEFTPFVRDYEEQMRVFFREAYGLSTAVAANLPPGGWHDMTRLDIEQQVQNLHGHVQREIAFAFSHAAPTGSACYGRVGEAAGEAPEVKVDAPACSAASQWGSGKWAMSDALSVELTCGKIKFVAEVNVIGTKKLKWGPLKDLGADLGMHAEVEITMEGTVTIFAGPKAGVSGKIGEFGGDFGVKDGIYAVIGKDGVQDVGMRVVVGGGVAAGQAGGTHDVDQMDFSFVSAL